MSNKISALVFSINEYELVHPKIKLLYPYVDEIVIIDSSTDKTQKRLMRNLEKKFKKVRVIWLPPLGVVEFYYKIGIDECKYDWIFQLDADDIPSKKLLEDLRKLVNDKYDAYIIKRDVYAFKLFKRKCAYPLGLIHWLMSVRTSISKIKILNSKEYFVNTGRIEEFQNFYNRYLKKYTYIESFQSPAKLLYAFLLKRNNVILAIFLISTKKAKVYYLFSLFSSISYLTFLLSFLFYMSLMFLYMLFGPNRPKNIWLRYPIFTTLEFMKSPYRNLFLAKNISKIGLYDLFELNSKRKLLENSKKLGFGTSGIENLRKLINSKFRDLILKEKIRTG